MLKAIIGSVLSVGSVVANYFATRKARREFRQELAKKALEDLRRREAAGSRAFQDVWDRHGGKND